MADKKTIKVRICDIGIEDAEKILGVVRNAKGKIVETTNNDENRPYRAALAKRYCSDIVRKKWMLNGESIVITSESKVGSGQHRCRGLIMAEEARKKNVTYYREKYGWNGPITIPVVIVTGISSKAVETLDLGFIRKPSDVLFVRKTFDEEVYSEASLKKLSAELAVAARLVWLRTTNKKVSDAPHFPHSEMLDFIKLHPKLQDCVSEIFNTDQDNNKGFKNKISKGYMGGLTYLFSHSKLTTKELNEQRFDDMKCSEQALDFARSIASGEGLKKGDPAYELREHYMREKAKGGSSNRDATIGSAIVAWNDYIDGKKTDRKKLKIKKDEMPRVGGLDTAPKEEKE